MKKKNPVAKHAKSTTSGSGPHKDRKKSLKRGETKHKKEKFNEVSMTPEKLIKLRKLKALNHTKDGMLSLHGDDVRNHANRADHHIKKAKALQNKMKVTPFNRVKEDIEDTRLRSIHPMDRGSEDEYDMEGSYVKNQIHTMLRVLTHLEHALDDDENLPEWVEDKMSQAKGMLVSVMDYIISEKEMALDSETGEEGHMMAENKRFIVKRNSYEAKLLESLSRAIYKLR